MTSSRQNARVRVYVDGDPEQVQDLSRLGFVDENGLFAAEFISARRGLGASGLDQAIFFLDQINTAELLKGGLLEGSALTFRVEVEDEAAGESKTIHYGRLASIELSSSGNDDSLTVVSATRPYMLGVPLYQMYMRDNENFWSIGKCHLPFVFNPVVDGIVTGNRTEIKREHVVFEPYTSDSEKTTYIFESLESARSRATKNRPQLWKVSEAVEYLLAHLGSDVFFSSQPTLEEIEEQITGGDSFLESINATSLRNVTIPYGTTLARALDIVLSPYGWSWYVEHDGDDRKIKFVNTSQPQELVLPWSTKAGEVPNTDEHDTHAFRISYDMTQLANRVEVLGSLVRSEAMFQLQKGWDEQYDDLSEEDLRNVYSLDGETDIGKRDAWSKWVLNEAEDYKSRIDSYDSDVIVTQYDLRELLTSINRVPSTTAPAQIDSPIKRRRRFMPTISTRTDGTPAGPVNGIKVEVQTEEDGEWMDLPDDYGVYIHSNECAISFTQPTKDFAGVRVCATIEGDYRIRYTADLDGTSVNSDAVTQVLYMPGRFQYSVVDQSSPYFNLGTDDEANGPSWIKDASADDSTTIADFAGQFLNANDVADVVANITLDGLDRFSYELGYGVQEIFGRDISLNGKSPSADSTLYPVIESIEYDNLGQTTNLTCRTNRGAMR